MRHCFQRTATRSPPMKLKRLSRCPITLLPSTTSVWFTPSIGRSVGTLPPTMLAKVGRKSMIENIAYELVSGLTCTGQRMKQKFRFFFQAEDGIRDHCVTGVQTCALPI